MKTKFDMKGKDIMKGGKMGGKPLSGVKADEKSIDKLSQEIKKGLKK